MSPFVPSSGNPTWTTASSVPLHQPSIRRPTPSIPKPPAFEERSPRISLKPAAESTFFETVGEFNGASLPKTLASSDVSSRRCPPLQAPQVSLIQTGGVSLDADLGKDILPSELMLLKHLKQGTHFLV